MKNTPQSARSSKSRRRSVDFQEEYSDYQCALLGLMGFSNRFIESETGLTPSQVYYRLTLVGIRRSDYRDGGGEFARMTLSSALREGDKLLQAKLGPIRKLATFK